MARAAAAAICRSASHWANSAKATLSALRLAALVERGFVAAPQFLGPVAPIARPLPGDRLENREAAQRLAARDDERRMFGEQRIMRLREPRALESGPARLQQIFLEAPDGFILHRSGVRRIGDAIGASGDRRLQRGVARQVGAVQRIDIDRIEKAPVGRIIGARAFAIVGEKNMQRIDAERRRADSPRRFAKQAERGEIADALVARAGRAFAPLRIELRAEAEAPAPRAFGEIGGLRRDRQFAGDIIGEQAMAADRQRAAGRHSVR